MEAPRHLSIVSYAVNGSGLGHLSRMVAINRWIRRYSVLAGIRTQQWFLTTSEADTLLFHEGFAGFKLPSKSIVDEAGIPKPAYLGLAKQWVWHSVGLLRPDILLVDTFPNGSFQELLGVLDLCRHKALVLRPVKEEFAQRASFRAMAQLYDRVIVPEDPPGMGSVDVADALGLDDARVRHVGPVMLTERFELLPRDEARRRLGVPTGATCLLVSAGGGGDPGVDAVVDAVLELVAERPDVHAVVAAGPLHRGPARHGPRVTFWTAPGLGPHLSGVDAAVSAAGFNTLHELALAGVPALFIPQEKVADDQQARVSSWVERGAALTAQARDAASVRRGVEQLLDPVSLARLREAAPEVFTNHARDAAAEVLSLVLPPSLVRGVHGALTDEFLGELGTRGVSLAEAVDLWVALHPDEDAVDRAAPALSMTRTLMDSAARAGAPTPAVTRVAQALGRRMRSQGTTTAAVADALCLLLHHRATTGQWTGLAALVRAFGTERELSPRAFADLLMSVADQAAAAGVDLAGLARLATDTQTDGELGNAALAARLRERLRSEARA
ncbi:MAG: hypothetical protein HY904_12020 [Deltaproteobacteria bacterium]|nr:hypothetical protein [Deltaproteobacteria bacterium]